jgi:hypothetical protein
VGSRVRCSGAATSPLKFSAPLVDKTGMNNDYLTDAGLDRILDDLESVAPEPAETTDQEEPIERWDME